MNAVRRGREGKGGRWRDDAGEGEDGVGWERESKRESAATGRGGVN